MNTQFKGRRPLAVTALVVVVGGASSLAFGLHGQPARAAAPAVAPAVPVTVAAVLRQDAVLWSDYSGRLDAVDRVDVRSRAAGTVAAVHFREGALVKAGDPLVSIDPAPYQAEVDRANALLLAAQARADYTTVELERTGRLWNDHAVARHDLDVSENAARVARADVLAARAALQTAKLNLGYTTVRAPVSGRVGRLAVTPGNLVSAGPDSPVLTTLVSVSPIYASFDADEATVTRTLAELPGGAGSRTQIDRIPVRVGALDGSDSAYRGRLQLVDNQIDARSGTVHLRAVLDNKDGALMPGQFARIRLGQAKPHPVLLVDERAIGTDQDKRFVMTVGSDNTAVYRLVTLGASVDGRRVVTSGLQANERVIVDGLQHVKPGARVHPQWARMSAQVEAHAQADVVGDKS